MANANFVYLNLRCILLPNHMVAIYFTNFQVGKDAFWNKYFPAFEEQSPIFSGTFLGNEVRKAAAPTAAFPLCQPRRRSARQAIFSRSTRMLLFHSGGRATSMRMSSPNACCNSADNRRFRLLIVERLHP